MKKLILSLAIIKSVPAQLYKCTNLRGDTTYLEFSHGSKLTMLTYGVTIDASYERTNDGIDIVTRYSRTSVSNMLFTADNKLKFMTVGKGILEGDWMCDDVKDCSSILMMMTGSRR